MRTVYSHPSLGLFACVRSIPMRLGLCSVHSRFNYRAPWATSGSFLRVRSISLRPERRRVRSVHFNAPWRSPGSLVCVRSFPGVVGFFRMRSLVCVRSIPGVVGFVRVRSVHYRTPLCLFVFVRSIPVRLGVVGFVHERSVNFHSPLSGTSGPFPSSLIDHRVRSVDSRAPWRRT